MNIIKHITFYVMVYTVKFPSKELVSFFYFIKYAYNNCWFLVYSQFMC